MKFRTNRLSLHFGTWSPFSKNSSSSDLDGLSSKRRSTYSTMAIPVVAQELKTHSENGMTNGHTHHTANGVAVTDDELSNPATSTSRLMELAQIITRETEKLDKFFKQSGIPMPSFDIDAPLDFPGLPEEIKTARQKVVESTKELGDLFVGPTESVRWMAWDHNNSLSLHAVYYYGFANSFPVGGTATYAEIAKAVNLDELNVRRFIRHAITNRIFKEVSPGVVAHTAISRVLAEDKPMQDWVGFCTEDMWPAASRTIDALTSYPSASSILQTGFCMANNTPNVEPMFATIGRSPARAQRFGGAMKSLTGGEGYEVSYLLESYDWSYINAIGGTMVDVGGSHGFVCIDLAKRWKKMRFIVQDLPNTIATAPKYDGDLGERILFQAHDFMTEQPIRGADVYFFRWIFHNQSDTYAIPMLRALIPALKKGARILINDHCLPEPGQESLWDEKIMRTMDLVMLTLLNAQERTAAEFEDLFRRADPRFVFRGVTRPKGCRMSIIEAVWAGDGFEDEKIMTSLRHLELTSGEIITAAKT